MCGRYTLTRAEARALQERFNVEHFSDTRIVPRFNAAPSQEMPVILSAGGSRNLEFFKWGLIPSWVKDLKKMKPMINARAETIAEKPFFKGCLTRRRCLIPADGFYEWKQQADGKGKVPMWIHRKDRGLFGFAGLWDQWASPDGEVLRTYTVITTGANSAVAQVHDRMPVILLPEAETTWLDQNVQDVAALIGLLQPYPDDLIEMYPVSTKVNSVKWDSQECVADVRGYSDR